MKKIFMKFAISVDNECHESVSQYVLSFDMYLPADLNDLETKQRIDAAASHVNTKNQFYLANHYGVADMINIQPSKPSYSIADEEKTLVEIMDFDTPSYIAIKTDEGWGVIDNLGIVIVPCTNDLVITTSSNGYIVFEKNGKTGVFCINYDICTLPEYDEIYDEGLGSLLTVVFDGQKGYLNHNGVFVSESHYNSLSEDDKAVIDLIGSNK